MHSTLNTKASWVLIGSQHNISAPFTVMASRHILETSFDLDVESEIYEYGWPLYKKPVSKTAAITLTVGKTLLLSGINYGAALGAIPEDFWLPDGG